MGERDATRDSTHIDDRPGERDPGRFDRTDDDVDAEGRGSIASSTPAGEYERGRRDEARDEGR
jgi:hypothetical protein